MPPAWTCCDKWATSRCVVGCLLVEYRWVELPPAYLGISGADHERVSWLPRWQPLDVVRQVGCKQVWQAAWQQQATLRLLPPTCCICLQQVHGRRTAAASTHQRAAQCVCLLWLPALQAFLFAYSMREKTHAARHYEVSPVYSSLV